MARTYGGDRNGTAIAFDPGRDRLCRRWRKGRHHHHVGTQLPGSRRIFFSTDNYIPLTAVESSTEEEVYLNVTKDEALTQEWDIVPTTEDEYASTQPVEYVEDASLRVSVHEEHLEASKRVPDADEVTISKRVVTKQETIEVPVTEEAGARRLARAIWRGSR